MSDFFGCYDFFGFSLKDPERDADDDNDNVDDESGWVGYLRGSYGLSGQRAQRTKSGHNGPQLEVGARRATRLLFGYIWWAAKLAAAGVL